MGNNGPAPEMFQTKLRAELAERQRIEEEAARANEKPPQPPAEVKEDQAKKKDHSRVVLDKEDPRVKEYEIFPDEEIIEIAVKNGIVVKPFNRTTVINALIDKEIKP